MDSIWIQGGKRLEGKIPISGAKNAALTLLPCALLTDEPLIGADDMINPDTIVNLGDGVEAPVGTVLQCSEVASTGRLLSSEEALANANAIEKPT